MIKLKGRNRGKNFVVIGLSHANLDKLRADGVDGYIRVDGEEMGLSCDIVITAGPTEADLFETFSGGIGPETIVHISDKLKS